MWSEEGLDKVRDVERDLFVMHFTKSKDGKDGNDGKDGKDGKDSKDGKDGE